MADSQTTAALLGKLTAWNRETGDFHADRQLADEVLIACGWAVQPDPAFRGGFAWSFGTNPRVSTSEDTRSHPIHSLDAALGQLPFGWRVCSMKQPTADLPWTVQATSSNERLVVLHPELTVAVCMVAVKAWRSQNAAV